MSRTSGYYAGMIIAFTAAVLSLPAFNYKFDLTRVLHCDFSHRYVSEDGKVNLPTNDRFLRTRFILSRGDNLDSFIMGSSRVEHIDTSSLGENWYGYYYPTAMQSDHLKHLKVLLANGHHVRSVVIAVDKFCFYRENEGNESEYRETPLGLNESASFYTYYLWKKPGDFEWDILRHRAVLSGRDDIIPGPKPLEPVRTDRIGAFKDNPLDRRPYGPERFSQTVHIDDTIETIREIKRLCEENGVRLTLFVNPFSYKNYLATDHDELDDVFIRLAEISPFYDFSGPGEVTLSNGYWLDPSHYNDDVGKMILDVLFRNGAERGGSFGTLVTPDNVVEHRAAQRRKIAESITALLMTNRLMYVDESLLTGKTVIPAGSGSPPSHTGPAGTMTYRQIDDGALEVSVENIPDAYRILKLNADFSCVNRVDVYYAKDGGEGLTGTPDISYNPVNALDYLFFPVPDSGPRGSLLLIISPKEPSGIPLNLTFYGIKG